MAAEASRTPLACEQTNFARPPRIPFHSSSLAATAADPRARCEPMAAAWACAWVDMGGVLMTDTNGNRSVGWTSDNAEVVAAPFDQWSDAELHGARRAMLIMLEQAGVDALSFAFGLVGREA